ncbi:MAG: selenocysteine-specific translation elongation factor [Novosphingobium sp.]|nr:selenocysteine-specific translation elongation factor [Novosphingobium sp.]MCP5401511.1 selenocysteine-specific translation elongation factor [Novosphingobium sp.]
MSRIVCGVIGHVDHGKTALVRALTGEDTDRLAEEKERGISIALGFAHLPVGPDTLVDLIDMPGHERFVRTMISGATGIDAVLLVVAANEGVKPQTVEHLDIAALLGLRRAVVAVTKCDLVDFDEAERVAQEAMDLLAALGMEAGMPVRTSAQDGAGIEGLRTALEELAGGEGKRSEDGIAYLPIDRAFSMAGHGPVVTGTLRGAPVSAGQKLELLPAADTVRVRALQVHGERVDAAKPGQRTAVNLRDVETGDLKRGMALAEPGSLEPSEWLTISIRAVAGAPPLRNGMRLRALFGTSEVDARLRLLDRDVLEPGESGFAQLHLVEPAAVPAREHAVLRIASPAQTVAGGRILEPVVRRRRRNAPDVLQRLRDLRDLSVPELVAAEALRETVGATSIAQLSQLTALARVRIEELLRALPVVVTRKGLIFRKSELEALLAQLPALLAPHATGMSRNQLLSALPGTRAALLDEALSDLAAAGAIARRGSQYLVPRPEDERVQAQSETELAERIAETLRLGSLAPPNPSAILVDAAARRAVDRLLRGGTVIRAVDRAKGREMLFHRDAVDEAKRRLGPLLRQGPGLLVTEIGAALGISRKFTMPLIDHLDTIRFTRREGDRRYPAIPNTEQQT